MKKYLWVIESKEGVLLTHETDDEHPHVGARLDLSKFSKFKKFGDLRVQRVVRLLVSDEPNFVFVWAWLITAILYWRDAVSPHTPLNGIKERFCIHKQHIYIRNDLCLDIGGQDRP